MTVIVAIVVRIVVVVADVVVVLAVVLVRVSGEVSTSFVVLVLPLVLYPVHLPPRSILLPRALLLRILMGCNTRVYRVVVVM